MKHRIMQLKSIEDDPMTLKALLAFANQPDRRQPTLSEYLNRIMADKHLESSDVYHRADLGRQTYNRLIQVGKQTRASRRTLLQVAIGIYASEREATELLATCGYTFELSSKYDRAVLFCIRNGYYSMYNVYEANEILDNEHAR